MSDAGSAIDLTQFFEAYPSLKYAFALGAMIITLRGIFGSLQKLRTDPAPQAEDSAAGRLGRIERKLNRLLWEMREARQDLRDLVDIVRPGSGHRRPLTEFADDPDGN